MNKLNRIFSIVLTAAIAATMLVVSALPVSAADNAWTEFKVPTMSAYTGSGLLTKGADGALYVWTNTATANTNSLTKSTDGGRTWTSVKTPGATAGAAVITAIATSPSEANVVYIATGTSVWKSIDGGATFATLPVGTVPTAATSLAVGLLGGSYKVFAGTSGGVFLFDEGVTLNNQFVLFGGLVANVLDVKVSPTFNTAAGIYALTSTGTNASVYVSTGGAFAATPATVASGAGTTVGELGFSADFNVTSNPVLWVGVNGATGGIFRTTLGGTGFQLGTVGLQVQTIDVSGTGVFGGAVTVVAGTTASNVIPGAVYITSNAGVSGLTTAAKNLTGTGPSFVVLANDYATSSTVFVLQAAAAVADESAFSYSNDKAVNFAQISLINSVIASITSTAFASNGDIYMVTSGTGTTIPGAGDAFTLTSATLVNNAGDSYTLSSVLGTGTVTVNGLALVTAGTGSTVVGNVITFTAPNGIATVTATADTATFWVNGTATDTVATKLFDPNNSMTVAGNTVSFQMDMNPTATVTVAGAVAIAVTAPTTVTGAAPAQTVTFSAVGQVATVTATAAGNVTWTNATGTATALKTVDTNSSMTVAASGVAFAVDVNPTTSIAGPASLWRYMGGKWDRIQGNQAAGKFAKIAVSPNYATDKGVFYVAANIIWASSNNGVTFTAQSFSPGIINSYVALDSATFVAATSTGIMRTTNSGFVWNSVSTTNAAYLIRSSDATAMAAVTAAGDVFKSADLGATWTAALSTGLTLAGVSDVTFQNGSNTVLWATTSTGGIYKLDLAATTVAWVAQPTVAALDNGVGIVSGVAASPVIYVLDNNGSLTRLIGDASVAENIAAATGVTAATDLFIVPAAGGNTLWAVTATKLYTFKDTIAIAVTNVAVASITTSTANVTY
jgi:hypothetical protein